MRWAIASYALLLAAISGYCGRALAQSSSTAPASASPAPNGVEVNSGLTERSLVKRRALGLAPFYSNFEFGLRGMLSLDDSASKGPTAGLGLDTAVYANDWLGFGLQYQNLVTDHAYEKERGQSVVYEYRHRRWLTPFVELRARARTPITVYARGSLGPLWSKQWDPARQTLGDWRLTGCANLEFGVDFHWLVSARLGLLVAGLWPPDSPLLGLFQQVGFEF